MLYGTINPDPSRTPPARPNRGQLPRDVRGAGVTTGYFMREPETDWPNRRADFNRRKTTGQNEIQRREIQDVKDNKFRNEFLDKSEPKMIRGYIELLARAGTQALERDFKRRQEALKKILIQDELRWTTMEHDFIEQQKTDSFAEAKRYTEEVRAQQEAARQEFVEKQMERRFRNETDPMRKLVSKRMTADCKAVNLGQMRDKIDRAEADREEERMFAHLNSKILEAQMAREVEDARKKLANQILTQEGLRAQIAYKQQHAEREKMDQLCLESERIRMLQENLLEEQKKALEMKLHDREQTQKYFEEQITLRRRFIAETSDRDATEYEGRIRAIREQIVDEEAARIKAKAAARLEMSMLLNHVEHIKDMKERERKMEDEMMEELRKKYQRKEDLSRCMERECRRNLTNRTLQERAKQVKERAEMRIWEAELKKDEIAEDRRMLKCQQELTEQYEQKLRQEKRLHSQNLKSQVAYQELIKKRDEEEEQREFEKCQEEDEKFKHKILDLLEKPAAMVKHPFRYKIEGTALPWP